MKTLQEYILEAMNKEDFLQKIHDIYNDDYESAFNVLSKHDPNTLKENQEKLRDLFEKRDLPLNNRNESIIKNICREFNIDDTINDFVELCFNKEKDIFNIEGEESKILRNDKIFNFEKENENFMELFNYLIDISYFTKKENKASSGKFELLFILLYGSPNGNSIGDLQISDNTKIEIKSIGYKSKARLGTNVGKKSIEELSEMFLENIFTDKNDKKKIKKILRNENSLTDFSNQIHNFLQTEKKQNIEQRHMKPRPNRCLANESANINIMTILNTFFNGKIKQSEEKDLCKTIFESYINVLLSQYGQKDTNNNVYKVLENINPFFIKDDFIYCKKLTQITGAIHLYGYALNKGFNHILIGDQSTSECICIKNVNTVGAIITVLNNIIFEPAEINNEKNSIKNNVSKIKDFKKQ